MIVYKIAACAVAGALGGAVLATADTIYMTNGRVIHAGSTTVAGGRVHFTQFGGQVSIPIEEVLFVVEDDNVEKQATPSLDGPAIEALEDKPVEDEAIQALEDKPLEDEAIAAAEGDESSPRPVADDLAERPWSQPEYWIERVLEVDAQIRRVQDELDRLPLYDDVDRRLLRFSGQARYFIAERERWTKLMDGLQSQREELFDGARKAGITPGALRAAGLHR